jgi:hypothetical protein
MKRVLPTIWVTICLLVAPVDAHSLVVDITGDSLSVHAEGVPLQEILHRLIKAGIKVQISPEINPIVTASFEHRDLQKALETITRPYSQALIWEGLKGPIGTMTRLVEIQVFETGKRGALEPLDGKKTLPVATDKETGALFVANELLLRPGPGMGLAWFEGLLKRIGGRVIGIHPGTGVYRVRLERKTNVPALTKTFARFPGIAEIEPNFVYRVDAPIRGVTAAAPSAPGLGGKDADGDVPIAVLDTGMRHMGELADLIVAAYDAVTPGQPISDTVGHGTQMVLVASGAVRPYGAVAEDSPRRNPVIPVRLFDDNGMTSTFDIMKGLDFAVQSGARVISVSWGSETHSDVLEGVFATARKKGLIIVASAGNKPTGEPFYPAAYPSVVGVGALEPDGKAWKNSNYGSFVNVYAPGFANMPVGYKGDPGLYAGTSISAAYTANIIARYLSRHPHATLAEVFEGLKKE